MKSPTAEGIYNLGERGIREQLSLTSLVNAEDAIVEVLISRSLADRLQKRVVNSEFRSISDYAVSILDQMIERLDAADPSKGSK